MGRLTRHKAFFISPFKMGIYQLFPANGVLLDGFRRLMQAGLLLGNPKRIVGSTHPTSKTVGWLFNREYIRRLFMNLTISGHHLEVTPALRSYVTGKLDRITRHFDQVVDVKVLLTVEKQKEKEKRQRAECNIHVKGNDLFAESAHEDLYAAVDDLVDKLDRQVVRHKNRITDHHHTSPKRMM
jgi:putative sigma-54 modulation protein